MSNSIKDALKKLCLKITGKKSNKESIQDVIDDITKDYDGVSADYVEQRINERLVSVYTYKGSVQTYDDLPTQNLNVGDVYNVLDTGKNYAWTDTEWDELGGHIALYTDNIQSLTTKQINSLKCGDTVIKLTNNQQHCYIVSYKENNQGICLTYTDASVVETVSYDYNSVTKEWVYNSTDVTPLTSGVVYSAGDGIEITAEHVINNIAPGKTYYEHYISYYRDNSTEKTRVNAVVLNDSSTPFTKSGFIKWLYDNGFKNGAKLYPSSNIYKTSSLKFVGSGIFVEQDPGTTGNSVFSNVGVFYTNNTLSIDGPLIDLSLTTFTDTVFEK